MKENMQMIIEEWDRSLEMRMKKEEEIIKRQLKENNVFPRTYEHTYKELELRANLEKEDLLNIQK